MYRYSFDNKLVYLYSALRKVFANNVGTSLKVNKCMSEKIRDGESEQPGYKIS
jgi:hypothetical protein